MTRTGFNARPDTGWLSVDQVSLTFEDGAQPLSINRGTNEQLLFAIGPDWVKVLEGNTHLRCYPKERVRDVNAFREHPGPDMTTLVALKPCDELCSKCGSTDLHRLFVPANESIEVRCRKPGVRATASNRDDSIMHTCRCCGWYWFGRTLDQRQAQIEGSTTS